MDVNERNRLAKNYITDKLDLVSGYTSSYFEDLPNYEKILKILKDLIQVNAKGFRGIVATALTGKFLNPNYDPLNDFYSCNPRSIFEQGIFYAFENRIPCGKSDPLNVAKNINVLDDEWTNGKRPKSAAQAVVDFLRIYESSSVLQQEKLTDFFFFELHQYAQSIGTIDIELPEEQEWSPQLFATKLSAFVHQYPESGAVPQLIISILLKQIYKRSSINVEGGDESVFGTNTTSKKPADIWLEIEGKPFSLFEITVKKIDYKRLDDCIHSLHAVDMLNCPVHFICRTAVDIDKLNGVENGVLKYKGKTFNLRL